MTTKAQKLAPLPDPPEGKPEDMTNFNQTNITGNAHNLMHHLGNLETTLVLSQPRNSSWRNGTLDTGKLMMGKRQFKVPSISGMTEY